MFIEAFYLGGGGGVVGLVDMTFGLVHATMPVQAVKLTFFNCTLHSISCS